MKPIKIFCLLIILFCPLYGSENKNIEDYFLKIHANEKLEFLECVKKEDASPAQKVNTKCEISSEAKDAVFILYNKEVQALFSFLDQFTQYKRTNKVVPQYPRMAQEKGTEGFAIVKYSISKEGTVLDPKIIEGKCGDRRSPFTKFESCNVFNKEALRAVKKFKYEPVKFEGRKIRKNNVSHSFTFLMEEENLLIKKNKSRAFVKAQKAIKEMNFEKALTIAEANLTSDYIFMSIIASVNYEKGNYLKAKEWSNKLKDKLLYEGRKIPESVIIRIYTILISSLFNLGEYEELTNLEEEYSFYSKEKSNFKGALAMINLYYGISFISIGDIHKGAYYLGIASKNAASKEQLDYINNVIDQISIYL